jgi:hypothetical protein
MTHATRPINKAEYLTKPVADLFEAFKPAVTEVTPPCDTRQVKE